MTEFPYPLPDPEQERTVEATNMAEAGRVHQACLKRDVKKIATLEARLALAERALGALKAFEREIREAIGNTNWNVLMHHFANYEAGTQ